MNYFVSSRMYSLALLFVFVPYFSPAFFIGSGKTTPVGALVSDPVPVPQVKVASTANSSFTISPKSAFSRMVRKETKKERRARKIREMREALLEMEGIGCVEVSALLMLLDKPYLVACRNFDDLYRAATITQRPGLRLIPYSMQLLYEQKRKEVERCLLDKRSDEIQNEKERKVALAYTNLCFAMMKDNVRGLDLLMTRESEVIARDLFDGFISSVSTERNDGDFATSTMDNARTQMCNIRTRLVNLLEVVCSAIYVLQNNESFTDEELACVANQAIRARRRLIEIASSDVFKNLVNNYVCWYEREHEGFLLVPLMQQFEGTFAPSWKRLRSPSVRRPFGDVFLTDDYEASTFGSAAGEDMQKREVEVKVLLNYLKYDEATADISRLYSFVCCAWFAGYCSNDAATQFCEKLFGA